MENHVVVELFFTITFRARSGAPFNQNFRRFRSKTQWIGSVQREKFRKTGLAFEVDHFSLSDRSEFWTNGRRP